MPCTMHWLLYIDGKPTERPLSVLQYNYSKAVHLGNICMIKLLCSCDKSPTGCFTLATDSAGTIIMGLLNC